MSIFSEVLAKTGLPKEALAPIESKLNEAFDLIQENNKRVAQVNASKANDPNNTEFLDSLWRTHAPSDENMRDVEAQYQSLVDESEKLLTKLRTFAKENHIPEALSEEKTKEVRALVNSSAETISQAKAAAAAMATVVDSVLAVSGNSIEGGVISLLPPVESLKNARGRKASSGSVSYMTRVGEVQLDGKSTNREINGELKGKFNFAADDLSKSFGVEVHPDNKVTAEELEEAYFEALGKPLRSIKSTELPESFEFTFTREVKQSNPNDDGFTMIPKSVKVKVSRATVATPAKQTENAAPAKAAETKPAESKPAEVLKPADHLRPEPAKKTAAAKPSK